MKSTNTRSTLITGGTGLVGRRLRTMLEKAGHEVRILSRRAVPTDPMCYQWAVDRGWIEDAALDGVDTIVHLAGAGIADGRWTSRRRQLIIDSRVKSTQLLVERLRSVDHQVKTFVGASGVGYYGMVTRDEPFHETDPAGEDFLGQTCAVWEEASSPLVEMGIRRVILRSGIVLAANGGAYPKLRDPLKVGVAPVLGSGRQYVPWIHIEDHCRMFNTAIVDPSWTGVYNAVAPEHVQMGQLMDAIRQEVSLRVPKVTVPSWVLKVMLGEMAEMLLEGSPMATTRTEATGLVYTYPTLLRAIQAIEQD